MIGVLSWIAAGGAAAALARLVPRRREGVWAELLAAVLVAIAAGLLATALDFGGIATVDLRSAALAFLMGAAAIAALRIL
jgi:hypothetical protein